MKFDVVVRRVGEKGLGVIAQKTFKKGVLVVRGIPEGFVGERTNHSFQLDTGRHIQLNKPARLINHSCDPNLGVNNNRFGGYDFFAIGDIRVGEELTWDYSMTEFISIAIENNCLCKSNNCRGRIGGFVCLPLDLRNKYNDFIADYLRKL